MYLIILTFCQSDVPNRGIKGWDEDALRLKPKHQLEGEKKRELGTKKISIKAILPYIHSLKWNN